MLKNFLNKRISTIVSLLIVVLIIGGGFLGYGIITAQKNHKHDEYLESLYDVTDLNNDEYNIIDENGVSVDYEEYLEFKEKAKKNFALEEVSFEATLDYDKDDTKLVGFELK